MQSQVTKGRIGWIDAARALGACAIVLLHVLVSTSLSMDVSRQRQVVYALVGIVGCRWVVPAFFMISGALLLDPARELSWKRVRAHVLRMLVVIVTFGTAFATLEEVWLRMQDSMPIGPGIVVVIAGDVLTAQTWDHLWFVYAMVGVYLLAPALCWVRQRFGERGFLILTAALFVVVLCIPTLLGGMPAPGPISTLIKYTAIGVTCFAVGGCLSRWELSPAWEALGVGSLIIMELVSIVGIGSGEGDRGYIFLQGSCFACLYAVFVLLVLKRFVGQGPLPSGSITNALAQDSFGVYIIHPLFIHVGLLLADERLMVPVVYEIAFWGVALVASVISTRLLRRIPLFTHVL